MFLGCFVFFAVSNCISNCALKYNAIVKALHLKRMNYLEDLSLKCSWIVIAEVASWNKLATLTDITAFL